MSLTPYHLHWSDALISRVETRLRQLHGCLMEFYRCHNYPTDVVAEETNEFHSRDGPIQTVGSFLLRTCVHSTPFHATQLARGIGVDLALTLPETVCSMKDVQDGHYLERRHDFLLRVEKFLVRNSHVAAENVDKANPHAVPLTWKVERIPFGGCYANVEKEILRVTFIRSGSRREIVHVDVHIRPPGLSGRVASAAAVRRHPLYAHLVQEDARMPDHLRRLHALYSSSHALLCATVFLKCWAHHVGLMAASSGNAEGLSGFQIAAMVLRLVEEGIVSPGMSEENIVRAVWVQISRGFFTPVHEQQEKDKNDEETAAELRLAGETMNILFRTSANFFTNVVKRAADEALLFPRSADVIARMPFQPLQLRMDVALVIHGLHSYFSNGKDRKDITNVKEDDDDDIDVPNNEQQPNIAAVMDRSAAAVRESGASWSLSMRKAHALSRVAAEALGTRARFVTAWRDGPDTVQLVVQLSTEAEGRSRLTRGPPIENVEAVAAFNAFWGADIVSTRQFPDGGIYRCVLWDFHEDIGTHTTLALSASVVIRRVMEFALRRHAARGSRVAVLLGGLDGALAERVGAEWRDAAPCVQRALMEACRDVEGMITSLPRTALPCKITAVDIIAASERHTEAFPVRPHLALTRTTDDLTRSDFAGLTTAPTIEPVHAVLTIDDRGKIPDTLEAIATIKGAICAQLSKILQETYGEKAKHQRQKDQAHMKASKVNRRNSSSNNKEDEDENEESLKAKSNFVVRVSCTNNSVDIIHRGFLFRLYVAHYREVSLLRALQREPEAALLERKLFWSVQHAKFLRTIAFGHHSYATATRLAKRWVSAMLLSEFLLPEAVELLVANAYLGQNPPMTPAGGFLRFVQLLATQDWSAPLVLPYTTDGKEQTDAADLVRAMGEQQGMFIAAPYAPLESPFTAQTPRQMIMHRLVQLAKGVVALLLTQLSGHAAAANVEAAVFTSDPSAFDFQMSFHPHVLLQPDRILSQSMCITEHGISNANPNNNNSDNNTKKNKNNNNGICGDGHIQNGSGEVARVWQLDELEEDKSRLYLTELIEREPAAHIVRSLRAATRDRCMVFFDTLAPTAVHVITITPSPMWNQSQQLHDDILRISRGALLPAISITAEPATRSSKTGAGTTATRHKTKQTQSGGNDSGRKRRAVRDEEVEPKVKAAPVGPERIGKTSVTEETPETQSIVKREEVSNAASKKVAKRRKVSS